MSIVCIAAIVGLSAMGIGYGYWTDSLNIGVSVTTGYMKPGFISDGGNSRLSKDGNTLFIDREVYRGHDGDISVEIINSGSIPIDFENSKIDINETIEYKIPISIPETQLNIPEISLVYREETPGIEDKVTDIQLEINSIEEIINSIQEEIYRLNIIEKYNFKYELQFEQGI